MLCFISYYSYGWRMSLSPLSLVFSTPSLGLTMKTISVLSLVILAACGKPQVNVDPEFLPYLSKFTADIGADTGNVSVFFDELPGDTVGLCTTNGNEKTI